MWCRNCKRETEKEVCEICGQTTEADVPVEIYWCANCNLMIIKLANDIDKTSCPLCGGSTKYLCADMRPVFPEERLLFEIVQGNPLRYINDSVWASDNRYYINGKPTTITSAFYKKVPTEKIQEQLQRYSEQNSYDSFEHQMRFFVAANRSRLDKIRDEAHRFIAETVNGYKKKEIVISFSGGKDSTVTADLVVRALGDPSVVHIFGDTTLEFPTTMEYVDRFKKNNPKAILKVARNKEQDFIAVCEDIGPPARMLRWCCSMFKTGPITRVLNRLYGEKSILSFYGIRKCESQSRSRYNRIEDGSVALKIQKQHVASPIFLWKDIDIWLYILGEGLDFNEAYRFGYDRVGCWCCPNNSLRAQFLSQIYMPVQFEQWRSFLVGFAKRIGKPDAEEYVDSGAWKARQGGNGVKAAQNIKIRYTNCTAEDNAKIYQLNKPMDSSFIELFIPLGRLAPELGRKLINETIVIDIATSIPILSIQPFIHDGYEYSVKVKTLNVANHDDLQRMVGYQIKKYNACRGCLRCESLCRQQAISITKGVYHIDEHRCTRCRMCLTAKYLKGGCMMEKYLKTKGL